MLCSHKRGCVISERHDCFIITISAFHPHEETNKQPVLKFFLEMQDAEG